MNEAPIFAIVGRVNKGKTSVVSTLTENDSLKISKEPGTTRSCQRFDFVVDEQTLFCVIDTPGFEQASRALEWLKQHETTAAERPMVLQAFLNTFYHSNEFREECALLQPIVDGARIMYVVDGSHPYRVNYEAEMEILRWSGKARMALINPIAGDAHVENWRSALDQYFSIVRVFNPHLSTFDARIDLLSSFGLLRQQDKGPIEAAIKILKEKWQEKHDQAAYYISQLIADALTFKRTTQFSLPSEIEPLREKENAAYLEDLREKEKRQQKQVENLYGHLILQKEENPLHDPLLNEDLFSDTTWSVLGLTIKELVKTGALSGAAAGGVIDAMVGESSFFAGAFIGGVIGAISPFFVSKRLANVRILGKGLSSQRLQTGPIKSANFPWILLDRALIHLHLIATRAHARRDVLSVDINQRSLVKEIAPENKKILAKLFKKLPKLTPENLPRQLEKISQLIRWPPGS